ncbi:MAG: glycosyltransferase family 4 protein [Candidatus Aminicenantales bacterium]
MKIATNTSLSPIGGIARRVREMKRAINQGDAQHTLVIIEISPEGRSIEEDTHTRHYRVPLPENVEAGTIYRGLKSLSDLEHRFAPTIHEIQAILRREEVDVVLSEGTYYAPWCLYRAARDGGFPLIILYAGVLKYETRHFPQPMRDLLVAMENDFIDPRLMYLFPSRLTRSAVEKEYGSLPRYRIIPNGIAREFFELEPADTSDGIGFVGRATKIKNPEFLIKLKRELKRQKRKYPLYMVSEIGRKNRLRKRLRRAGVRILPVMDTRALRDFYRDMGVIISPSAFETYGNVPAESLAAGTPALVSENMGVAEVFRKLALDEFITDFRDVRAVVEKIESLRHRTVDGHIRRSLREYTWEAIIQEYIGVCAAVRTSSSGLPPVP